MSAPIGSIISAKNTAIVADGKVDVETTERKAAITTVDGKVVVEKERVDVINDFNNEMGVKDPRAINHDKPVFGREQFRTSFLEDFNSNVNVTTPQVVQGQNLDLADADTWDWADPNKAYLVTNPNYDPDQFDPNDANTRSFNRHYTMDFVNTMILLEANGGKMESRNIISHREGGIEIKFQIKNADNLVSVESDNGSVTLAAASAKGVTLEIYSGDNDTTSAEEGSLRYSFVLFMCDDKPALGIKINGEAAMNVITSSTFTDPNGPQFKFFSGDGHNRIGLSFFQEGFMAILNRQHVFGTQLQNGDKSDIKMKIINNHISQLGVDYIAVDRPRNFDDTEKQADERFEQHYVNDFSTQGQEHLGADYSFHVFDMALFATLFMAGLLLILTKQVVQIEFIGLQNVSYDLSNMVGTSDKNVLAAEMNDKLTAMEKTSIPDDQLAEFNNTLAVNRALEAVINAVYDSEAPGRANNVATTITAMRTAITNVYANSPFESKIDYDVVRTAINIIEECMSGNEASLDKDAIMLDLVGAEGYDAEGVDWDHDNIGTVGMLYRYPKPPETQIQFNDILQVVRPRLNTTNKPRLPRNLINQDFLDTIGTAHGPGFTTYDETQMGSVGGSQGMWWGPWDGPAPEGFRIAKIISTDPWNIDPQTGLPFSIEDYFLVNDDIYDPPSGRDELYVGMVWNAPPPPPHLGFNVDYSQNPPTLITFDFGGGFDQEAFFQNKGFEPVLDNFFAWIDPNTTINITQNSRHAFQFYVSDKHTITRAAIRVPFDDQYPKDGANTQIIFYADNGNQPGNVVGSSLTHEGSFGDIVEYTGSMSFPTANSFYWFSVSPLPGLSGQHTLQSTPDTGYGGNFGWEVTRISDATSTDGNTWLVVPNSTSYPIFEFTKESGNEQEGSEFGDGTDNDGSA